MFHQIAQVRNKLLWNPAERNVGAACAQASASMPEAHEHAHALLLLAQLTVEFSWVLILARYDALCTANPSGRPEQCHASFYMAENCQHKFSSTCSFVFQH